MLKPFANAPDDNKFFPRLKALPNSPAPCYVLRFLCFLGPIALFLLIVTFEGKFFRLTFSYFAKKERSSGNFTRCGVTFRFSNI